MQVKPKFHLARHVTSRHDTFVVSSSCILAVSSLSNSTARHAYHDELYWLDTSNVSCRVENVFCRVETWRAELNLGFNMCCLRLHHYDILWWQWREWNLPVTAQMSTHSAFLTQNKNLFSDITTALDPNTVHAYKPHFTCKLTLKFSNLRKAGVHAVRAWKSSFRTCNTHYTIER